MGLSIEDLINAMRAPNSPFRIVQANSNPIVVPLTQATVDTIRNCPSCTVIASRVREIERNRTFQTNVGDAIAGRYPVKASSQFVEKRIYDDFPTPGDMRLAAMFHQSPWDARRPILNRMADDRLRHLGLRLLGIEASHCLSPEEGTKFSSWQQSRRVGPAPKHTFRTVDQAITECRDLLECAIADEKNKLSEILTWLEAQVSQAEFEPAQLPPLYYQQSLVD